MADEFGGARRPGRPAVLLVGGDQQRSSTQSSDIGGRFGIPERLNQRTGGASSVSSSIRSGSHPSHGLRIDGVILAMGAKKSDGEDAGSILQRRDQPKVVSFDVERDCAIARAARSATRLRIASARP
jgi:hypothetical protein